MANFPVRGFYSRDKQDEAIKNVADILHYCPETGIFRWKVRRGPCVAGDVAGNLSDGYIVLRIYQRSIKAHRLAWFMVHGEFPDCFIDHINGDRSDNRIANLRLATPAQNSQNMNPKSRCNATGFKGVYPKRDKFAAGIWLLGKYHHVGTFDTAEAAFEARQKAKAEIHQFSSQ